MKKLLILPVILSVLMFYGCDRVPEFTSDPVTDAYEGVEYSYEVRATDPDGKAIKYSLVEGPAGMQVVDNVVTWTPTIDNVGDHTIRIKAADTTKFAIQEFTLTVHYAARGYAKYFNLSDEYLYTYPGIQVRISGGSLDETTTTDEDGLFYFADVEPGTYRYDFQLASGAVWSVTSSERNFVFINTARIHTGTAKLRVTVTTDFAEGKTVNILANSRSSTLSANQGLIVFNNLFPTSIESITVKQWAEHNGLKDGNRIKTIYPKTFTYLNRIILQSGVTKELDFDIDGEDSWQKNIMTRISGYAYSQERYGYVRMANTTHQLDISRQMTITNATGSTTKMAPYKGRLASWVSYGQNHEKIYEYYDYAGWAPYKGMNRSENHEDLELALSYARQPSVSSGSVTYDYVPAVIRKSDEQKRINIPGMFEEDQALSVSGDDKILVKVVQGVGTTPTFSWNKPVYNGRHPDLYVPTVVKVDANNAYEKTIWRGVTAETSVQFPALNQAVLQTGGRYVFYVMAYAAWNRKMTTGEVFWYPESEVYWTSRSEGVIFEP